MSALMKDVQSYPDAYLHERAFRFGVSVTGIFLALRRLGIRSSSIPKILAFLGYELSVKQ